MAERIIDDGGDNSDGLTWATAYTSINSLITAEASFLTTSGNIVYFGHDSQCQATNSADLPITGPSSGAPVVFISATQGSDPPTYAQGTGNQIDTTEGAYLVTFNGSFALYGIRVVSGANIRMSADSNEQCFTKDCTFVLAANGSFDQNSGSGVHENLTIDLTADGTSDRDAVVLLGTNLYTLTIKGLTFVNAAYRTAFVFGNSAANYGRLISGADFSGFTNATTCEVANPNTQASSDIFVGCKTAATWTPITNVRPLPSEASIKFVNCGNADQPVSLIFRKYSGDLVSSSSIYRTGGQSIESTANAWLITTESTCNVDYPFYSEYIYGVISSTGSKTFDLYITNDTADLNNDEIWLEVEYKADASSGEWTLATDKIATRTTTPAAQTDDTTSTWNGTGPSFTYKQKLSVTATVNTTGQYRARVAVGKASIAASSYLYVDPKVIVS